MLRFEEQASVLFHHAREEAERLGHGHVAPEHLLLGLLREESGVSRVLHDFGVDLEAARDLVEGLDRDNPSSNEMITVSAGAQRVMELAGDEAQAQGTEIIATRHILLGILTFVNAQENEVQVGRVLSRLIPEEENAPSGRYATLRKHLISSAEGHHAG